MHLCFGVGFNDGSRPAKINRKNQREYTLWNNMLKRCYSDEYKKLHPTYSDCSVSDNFKSYSYFYDWCQRQIGFNLGWELDKDILFKGNKLYSENTCVFVPMVINKLLVTNLNVRGSYPVGVLYHKASGKLSSSISVNGKRKHLGLFLDVNEAFLTYKTAKENYIIEFAEKYKNDLDYRAYQSLINHSIEPTD